MYNGEMGISFKKIGRGIARGAKGAARGVARGTVAVAKTAGKVALLPTKLVLAAASKAAGVVCKLPPGALSVAGAAGGVPGAGLIVPKFCQALRSGKIGVVTSLLPSVIKIASGATKGRLPPRAAAAVPIITEAAPVVIRPTEEEIPQEEEPAVEDAMEGLGGADIDLLDYIAAHDDETISSSLAGASNTQICAALGAAPNTAATWTVIGLATIAVGFGLFGVAVRRY